MDSLENYQSEADISEKGPLVGKIKSQETPFVLYEPQGIESDNGGFSKESPFAGAEY